MAKRKRDVPVLFYVSKDEMELIQQKMQAFGTSNMSAYLRKMAIDGYVLKLDLPELKELVSLLRRWSNNLNQLTRRVHQTGRVYDADLQELNAHSRKRIWDGGEADPPASLQSCNTLATDRSGCSASCNLGSSKRGNTVV